MLWVRWCELEMQSVGTRGKLASTVPTLVAELVLLDYMPKHSHQLAGVESVVR